MGILIVNTFSVLMQSVANFILTSLMLNKLSDDKLSRTKQILLILFIFIAVLSGTILKNFLPGINTLIYAVIQILSLIFITKNKLINCILITIGVLCIFAITEIISVYTSMFIFDITMEKILESTLVLLCASMLQFLLIIGVVFLYFKITNKKPINFDFLKDITNKQLLTLTALLIVYIFPPMLIFITNSYTYPIPLLIINSVQFVLICIIAFIFIKGRVEHEKTQSELFISELHNKTLIGLVDGVRTMKHDHNNIIQSLNGYVLTNQYDKLRDHIKVLLKECNSVNNLAVIDPKIFNEPAIYGIVGSKYFLANEKNITFDLDIVTNVAGINFSMPDLSRIFGILLDNAIEATLKSKEPYIRLEMHFDKRKCADVIKIYNTYDTSINIDIENIFKKGYSTKEVKSGIGLWEVSKLIGKNPNSQIFASIEKDKFVQTLIIEKNDLDLDLNLEESINEQVLIEGNS